MSPEQPSRSMRDMVADQEHWYDENLRGVAWFICRCWFCRLIKIPMQQLERLVTKLWVKVHSK